MTAKLWGGILVGVFIAAAGLEFARRRCPGLTQKISEGTRKALGMTGTTFTKFTTSARNAFQEGYSSSTV